MKKKVTLLTSEDMKGIETNPNWSQLDLLAAISAVAIVKYDDEKAMEEATIKKKKSEREDSSKKLTISKGERLMMRGESFKTPFTGALDISKGDRLMREKSSYKKPVMDSFDMSKEERLKREKMLKRPVMENPLDISSKGERLMMRDKSYKQQPVVYSFDISKEERLNREKVPVMENPLEMSRLMRNNFYKNIVAERLKRDRLLKRSVMENPNSSKYSFPKRVRFESKDSEEEEEARAKKKKKINNKGPDPSPDLPIEFRNRILAKGGSDVKLVIQKSLYQTDISPGHNRLSMPMTQIKEKFLREEEELLLNSHNGKDVLLIEPSLGECNLTFKKWDMRKESGKTSSLYVFIKEWSAVAKRNKLERDMIVQVWSFRVDGELCFALVNLETEGTRRGGSCNNGPVSCGIMAAFTSPSHAQQ